MTCYCGTDRGSGHRSDVLPLSIVGVVMWYPCISPMLVLTHSAAGPLVGGPAEDCRDNMSSDRPTMLEACRVHIVGTVKALPTRRLT